MTLGATAASAADVQIPVDDSFIFGDIKVEAEVGKIYSYALAIVVINDRVALCGVGQILQPGGASAIPIYLRRSSLVLDGKPILSDFSFWGRVSASKDLSKAKAVCRLTSTPAPAPGAEPDFEIRAPTLSYRG